MSRVGFHEGERDVQHRAGVEDEAARLERMLLPPRLDGGITRFLADRTLAVLTARDGTGRLWTSPLQGEAGFLDAHGTTLTVHAAPQDDDPLQDMPAGQEVGLLAIDFAIRRRVRVNGTLTAGGGHALQIDADQAFGNCPSYIQQRILTPAPADTATASGEAGLLTAGFERMIRQADTFFLGTTHPSRGTDTSHKGGNPGFVRVEDGVIWWPDYAGNNLFNSLGNIAVDPDAALLFVDFGTGTLVQLSGTAELEWVTPGSSGDDGGTGRRVRFHPQQIRTGRIPLRAGAVNFSPHNPELAA
ncbi:pyridoxamine 5'-phosphate oxidase family protein [Streptomyces sp. NPDC005181]|uniref:pyridoxamine 5'-phosphate oxidase family protein n=1 Tax=Streptomyces sp. NPDC005181 TaxID=3156869 RepID=UPI0033B3E1FA